MLRHIGRIIGGGLKANLQARLEVPAQNVKEGAFVVVESGGWLFYGLITDLQLWANDPRFAEDQLDGRFAPELAQLLRDQTLYTNAEIMTSLMMEKGPELDDPDYETLVPAGAGRENPS